MITKRTLLIAAFLIGCKSTPPPLAKGVCRTYVYEGSEPAARVCVLDGATWECHTSNGDSTCTLTSAPTEKP